MTDPKNYITKEVDMFQDENITFDIENYVKDLITSYQEHDAVTETIYILSKGRHDCTYTNRTLDKDNVPYKFIVEPQDYKAYAENHGEEKLVQLDKNNGGIDYARNFAKEYSKSQNEKWHWQMDDDIRHFKIRINDKNEKMPARHNLAIVENTTKLFDNIAIAGMASSAFAFSKKVPVKVNHLAYSCVLVNNKVDLKWDIGGCEDWHYTLCALEKKWCTIAFTHIVFDAPGTGVQKGGNMAHWESTEKRKHLYENFVKYWPNNFVVKPMGGTKGWKLQHKRRFFTDYKQQPVLKSGLLLP